MSESRPVGNNKIKICIITTISLTMRSFFLPQVRLFAEKTDWDITVICDYDSSLQTELPKSVHYIPIHMERGVSLGGITSTIRMARIFIKEKFDFVQYSTPNAAFYASIAAKIARIRHRRYHLMGFRYLGFSGLKRQIFKTLERVACKLSTDIECVSASNRLLGIEESLFCAGKSHVILRGSSAGVNFDQFDISQKDNWRTELRRQLGYAAGDFIFGFAGRITRDKGIQELIQAFQKLRGTNLYLILIGRTEQEDEFAFPVMERIASDNRIKLIPYVHDIERYFALMDVLVLPSYREGFGNIVIEAQAMGVPVIVTDIPGPTDAMVPGKTGLVVKKADILSLQNAMQELMDHAAVCKCYGQAGYDFVKENFEQKMLLNAVLLDRKKLLEPATDNCC